jgi:hypothetical protein
LPIFGRFRDELGLRFRARELGARRHVVPHEAGDLLHHVDISALADMVAAITCGRITFSPAREVAS